jgi:hypothetical protein
MSRYRAERPGLLPKTSDAVLGGVRLPRGRTIVASFANEPTTEPVLWISDDGLAHVGAAWAAIADSFAQHGLWPLVLEPLDGHPRRPWDDGELDPSSMTAPASHDAAAVLADGWAGAVPIDDDDELGDELAPFGGEFPGLARATTTAGTSVRELVAELDRGRLGLVPTVRPADAIAVLGWLGPANYENDVAKLAAVLRSWEDRFGAYLVRLGFATMTLVVERPPADTDHALAIAAEHFAFCPDNIAQGVGSLIAYASELVDAVAWHFWWD